MTKKNLGILGVIIFLGCLMTIAVNTKPDYKNYHCHKNGFLFESMNEAKNIFTKTKIKCLDIRDIEFRSSIKEIKK
tara:strand:- start:1040 stop:1267 length:228 start_codon:yes stop_codon:yes gene_type:complete